MFAVSPSILRESSGPVNSATATAALAVPAGAQAVDEVQDVRVCADPRPIERGIELAELAGDAPPTPGWEVVTPAQLRW